MVPHVYTIVRVLMDAVLAYHQVYGEPNSYQDSLELPINNYICDRIWENPPYGIRARFAQCAFLVAQV